MVLMSEIIEGTIEKVGFMSYHVNTGKERFPIYSSDGNLLGTTKPSWNTFAGLARVGQRVKIEGIFRKELTLRGFKTAFIAVRYV